MAQLNILNQKGGTAVQVGWGGGGRGWKDHAPGGALSPVYGYQNWRPNRLTEWHSVQRGDLGRKLQTTKKTYARGGFRRLQNEDGQEASSMVILFIFP